jgi:hypothetical protein
MAMIEDAQARRKRMEKAIAIVGKGVQYDISTSGPRKPSEDAGKNAYDPYGLNSARNSARSAHGTAGYLETGRKGGKRTVHGAAGGIYETPDAKGVAGIYQTPVGFVPVRSQSELDALRKQYSAEKVENPTDVQLSHWRKPDMGKDAQRATDRPVIPVKESERAKATRDKLLTEAWYNTEIGRADLDKRGLEDKKNGRGIKRRPRRLWRQKTYGIRLEL